MVVVEPGGELFGHPQFEVAMAVFPERDPSGLTMVQRMSRGEAIVGLAENAFNFHRHGRNAIGALALMVQQADPYRVVGDDPRAAASGVIDALADTKPRVAPQGGPP